MVVYASIVVIDRVESNFGHTDTSLKRGRGHGPLGEHKIVFPLV